jgi:hypothetical protein
VTPKSCRAPRHRVSARSSSRRRARPIPTTKSRFDLKVIKTLMTETQAEMVAEVRARFRHHLFTGASSPGAAIFKVVRERVEDGGDPKVVRIVARKAAALEGHTGPHIDMHIEAALAEPRWSANGARAEALPAARAGLPAAAAEAEVEKQVEARDQASRQLDGGDVPSASARGLDDAEQRPVATNGHSEPSPRRRSTDSFRTRWHLQSESLRPQPTIRWPMRPITCVSSRISGASSPRLPTSSASTVDQWTAL